MTEAILGLLLATSALVGMAGVLRSEWDHFKCEWAAFEVGHRQLTEGGTPKIPSLVRKVGGRTDVRVSDTGPAIHVEAQCGNAHAQIDFPKLRDAQW